VDNCATTTTKTKVEKLRVEPKNIGTRALKTYLLGYEVAAV